MNRTCLINNGYLGKKVAEVVGNFKNGFINGSAKVKFQYDFTVISNFENSTMVGLQRYYENKTTMNNYHYAIKGRKKSWSWHLSNEYLIYHDYSLVKESDTSEFSLLVPLNTSEEILVGKINLQHGQAMDLYREVKNEVRLINEAKSRYIHYRVEIFI